MTTKKPMKTSIVDLLTATTTEVLEHCTNELLKYYPRKADGKARVFILDEDFVYAAGDNPICLCSHIDTVRDRYTAGSRASVGGEKPVELEFNRNILTNRNGILGADDRAGVFGCLDLVRKASREGLPMPSVMFFNGEESGGIGVRSFCKTDAFKNHDKGTRLFVEMDRCNGTEWVTYGPRLPQPVIDYVESFGFHSGHGSYSDIADLQDTYLIPGVNLSIGYYSQHSAAEKLHIDEMNMTIARVLQMLRDPIAQLHPAGKRYSYTAPKATTYKASDFERSNGGSKNVSGGKGVSVSSSLPPDKEGKLDYDRVLDVVTVGGYCGKCGYIMADCTCGHLLKEILVNFDDEELPFLMQNYMTADDPMYEMLKEYLDAVADVLGAPSETPPAEEEIADDTNDPKSPFYVGKEGEQLQLPEATTPNGNTP